MRGVGGCAFVLSRFSRVRLLVAPWIVAHQASLATGFSRQEHWSGLPFPTPEDLLNPGMEPTSLTSLVLAVEFIYHLGRPSEGWRWWRICPQLCARQEKKVQEVEPPTLDGHHSLSKSTSGVFLLAGPTHGPVWEGTW